MLKIYKNTVKATSKWLSNVLVAIDQLGNTLAGGKPDITISARVGYFANKAITIKLWYWKFLEYIIDVTFYPIDGKKHCLGAFYNDNECGHVHGKDWMRVILGIFVLLGCMPIFIVTWSLYLLGHRPKNKNINN
jgi:hypothetical protein